MRADGYYIYIGKLRAKNWLDAAATDAARFEPASAKKKPARIPPKR
jgi:hypothetical protein